MTTTTEAVAKLRKSLATHEAALLTLRRMLQDANDREAASDALGNVRAAIKALEGIEGQSRDRAIVV